MQYILLEKKKKSLSIIKIYDGPDYIKECVNAEICNDGKIKDSKENISYRFIFKCRKPIGL